MTKRERTIAIVAVGAVGLLALNHVVLEPLWQRMQVADARVATAQQGLEEARNLFDTDLRARRKWKEIAGESLRTDAPSAEGQVLNHVRDWAQSAGLSLTSLKPERSEPEEGFQKITIRATGTGGMEQVARFLHSVQTAKIPVRVADVQIASRREGSNDLQLQVGLSTIYLPPEPANASAGAGEVLR